MEKLPGEIAKKMFPSAWTMMRAAEAVTSGSRTVLAPVFGTLLASTIGKVTPPLMESRILTLATATGALVVPATFQVTVCAPDHVDGPSGDAMAKGAGFFSTG